MFYVFCQKIKTFCLKLIAVKFAEKSAIFKLKPFMFRIVLQETAVFRVKDNLEKIQKVRISYSREAKVFRLDASQPQPPSVLLPLRLKKMYRCSKYNISVAMYSQS